jgi:hypothetical protein
LFVDGLVGDDIYNDAYNNSSDKKTTQYDEASNDTPSAYSITASIYSQVVKLHNVRIGFDFNGCSYATSKLLLYLQARFVGIQVSSSSALTHINVS